jgi:predicted O-methyltransferase YrrM
VSTLAEYYESLGYPPSRWHVGAEHPALEEYAVSFLRSLPRARVLEIGYQAGGFAVPLILALRNRPDFTYVGIDSMAYGTAVDGGVIAGYLEHEGVKGTYEFAVGDAGEFLRKRATPDFDLVLIDHDKRLYPRELHTLLRRRLVSEEGCVLMHDVLGKARRVWKDCAAIAHACGFDYSIVAEIPEGLAVVKRRQGAAACNRPGWIQLLAPRMRICGRQWLEVLRRWRRAGVSGSVTQLLAKTVR